ncbi:MAG: hypothetical protein WC477_01640 [Patescibacteria group bacterium]
MSSAIPSNETATYKDMFDFFQSEAIMMMRISLVNDLVPGKLIDLKKQPDVAFMNSTPGYIFDLTVADLVVEGCARRYRYVFLRDGCVDVCIESPGCHRLKQLTNWREGVCSIFERVRLTAEFYAKQFSACEQNVRARNERFQPFHQPR